MQSEKKLNLRNHPLIPKLSNDKTNVGYAYVYQYCNIFETLEFLAYGTQPIQYPNKIFCFMVCPTCDLRQALELIGLNRVPTDENGEKFLNYKNRKYMSDKANEQYEKIMNAKDKLEVLIDTGAVSCLLKDGAQLICNHPVKIDLDFTSKAYFKITVGETTYQDVFFDFGKLKDALTGYTAPQATYKLTIEDNGIYLQTNNGPAERVHGFNKVTLTNNPNILIVLKKITENPNQVFKLTDFDGVASFQSLLNKAFSKPKLKAIKAAFFDIHAKTILFKGKTQHLVKICN